jgi:hypothetical protein
MRFEGSSAALVHPWLRDELLQANKTLSSSIRATHPIAQSRSWHKRHAIRLQRAEVELLSNKDILYHVADAVRIRGSPTLHRW